MARELDEQLLESVAVRRRRLADSALWGEQRTRRTMTDNLARTMVSIIVAAVLCAGCVGWSFLQNALRQQQLEQQQREQQFSVVPSEPRSATASPAPAGRS